MMTILLMVVVVIVIIGLCFEHHAMKQKVMQQGFQEKRLVREAAEHSISASNTVNPLLALLSVTRGIQILESLHKRFGSVALDSMVNVNTVQALEVLTEQRDCIMRDLIAKNPSLHVQHPLDASAGFVHCAG